LASARLTVLSLLEGAKPKFELVDPVPEDLELGLVGNPALGGAAEPW
jgi:hypothetical protein